MSLLAPAPWLVAGGAAALALLVVGLALETQARPAAAPLRHWRKVALIVLAAMLWLLIARPARERAAPAAAAATAVLLTAGAERAAAEPGGEVFSLPGAPGLGTPVVDILDLQRRSALRRWLVAGFGLEPWQATALSGEVSFPGATLPQPGIDRASWRRRLRLGDRLEVRGSVSEVEGTLRLVGPAGLEAETRVTPFTAFALRATPRQEGRFLYRLELATESAAVAAEEIAVEVAARRPPRVLWLAGAPGFESREVKTWLRDLGGSLVVRTQVSRGRFRYEFLNHPRSEVARLDAVGLAEFDLLVAEGAAWEGLVAGERAALVDAVRAGLGLLLLPPLPAPGGNPGLGFEVEGIGDLETTEVEGRAPGGETLASLAIGARQFTLGAGQRPLLVDGAGRALAVARPFGEGEIAATLLEGTYRWSLRGEAESHRTYWSGLLAAVARRSGNGSLTAPAGPILVGRPLIVERVGEAGEPARVVGPAGDATRLAFAQDPSEPRRGSAVWWPRQTGWHEVTVPGGETNWWYVDDAQRWASWRQRQAFAATRLRAALGPAAKPAPMATLTLADWPRWPLFALLLLAWAALWADDQWRRGAPSAGETAERS